MSALFVRWSRSRCRQWLRRKSVLYREHKASLIPFTRASRSGGDQDQPVTTNRSANRWTVQFRGRRALWHADRRWRLLRKCRPSPDSSRSTVGSREIRISRTDPDAMGSAIMSPATQIFASSSAQITTPDLFSRIPTLHDDPRCPTDARRRERRRGQPHFSGLVSMIKVGKAAMAYVIDALGRLIAHPEISLVLAEHRPLRPAHAKARAAIARDSAETGQ